MINLSLNTTKEVWTVCRACEEIVCKCGSRAFPSKTILIIMALMIVLLITLIIIDVIVYKRGKK